MIPHDLETRYMKACAGLARKQDSKMAIGGGQECLPPLWPRRPALGAAGYFCGTYSHKPSLLWLGHL